jgi:hypothetical protein
MPRLSSLLGALCLGICITPIITVASPLPALPTNSPPAAIITWQTLQAKWLKLQQQQTANQLMLASRAPVVRATTGRKKSPAAIKHGTATAKRVVAAKKPNWLVPPLTFGNQTDPQAIAHSVAIYKQFSAFNRQGAPPVPRIQRRYFKGHAGVPWAQAFPLQANTPSWVEILETRVYWVMASGALQAISNGAPFLEGGAYRAFDNNGTYLVDSKGNGCDSLPMRRTQTGYSTIFYPSEQPTRATHFWDSRYDAFKKPAGATFMKAAYLVRGSNTAIQLGIDDHSDRNYGEMGIGTYVTVTNTPQWVTFDGGLPVIKP